MSYPRQPWLIAALCVSLSGCLSPKELMERARTKYQEIATSVQNRIQDKKLCKYGDTSTCRPEEICALTPGTDRAECVIRYSGSTPFVLFPFHPDHPVVCARGPQTPAGTDHSFENTLYAIDLKTPDPHSPPGTVFAGAGGTAFVHRACADKPDPGCGNGFGNHVRILTPEGHMLMYAHLGQIFLEDGQVVKRGDELGREGTSGKAEFRHLHFSVHFKAFDTWLGAVSYYRGLVGGTPPSIPFEIQYCDPAVKPDCKRTRVRVEQIPCGADAVELRGDWRE